MAIANGIKIVSQSLLAKTIAMIRKSTGLLISETQNPKRGVNSSLSDANSCFELIACYQAMLPQLIPSILLRSNLFPS